MKISCPFCSSEFHYERNDVDDKCTLDNDIITSNSNCDTEWQQQLIQQLESEEYEDNKIDLAAQEMITYLNNFYLNLVELNKQLPDKIRLEFGTCDLTFKKHYSYLKNTRTKMILINLEESLVFCNESRYDHFATIFNSPFEVNYRIVCNVKTKKFYGLYKYRLNDGITKYSGKTFGEIYEITKDSNTTILKNICTGNNLFEGLHLCDEIDNIKSLNMIERVNESYSQLEQMKTNIIFNEDRDKLYRNLFNCLAIIEI